MSADSLQRYTELQVALSAVREAAILCRRIRHRFSNSLLAVKVDGSPVTAADFGSQALICQALNECFPGDPIVAEEDTSLLAMPDASGLMQAVVEHLREFRPDAEPQDVRNWIDRGSATVSASRFWVLDPIDGTMGYVRGGQYAVCLALVTEGRVELSVLACPNMAVCGGDTEPGGVLFHAVRGGGAWMTSLEPSAESVPVHVSRQRDASRVRYCEPFTPTHSWRERSEQAIRRLGASGAPARVDSQAKYALVARGDTDAYLRIPRDGHEQGKIWDHASGALLVEEAGGCVTDICGAPLDFRHSPRLAANRGIVATNGAIHGALLEALADVMRFEEA